MLPFTRRPFRSGFTLVEIMIVVVIVGLLAAMAVQTFIQIKAKSQATILANDFRQFRDAFNTHALEHGQWPAQAAPGEIPPEMIGAVRGFDRSPVSGQWQWINDGSSVSVRLVAPATSPDVMRAVDEMLDDGDLALGAFRSAGTDFDLNL